MQGRKLGLVLLAVLVGLGLVTWWIDVDVGARPAVEEAVPRPAPPPPVRREEAIEPTPTPPSAPLSELFDGDPVEPMRSLPGRVRGRLAWQATRMPLVDAVVRAVRAFPDTVLVNDVERHSQERLPLRRREFFVSEPATTDRFGQFELAVPEIDGPLALLALRHGHCIEVRPLQPGPAAKHTIELGDWLLAPRGEVRGVVVDHHGHPVRGARVRLIDVPLEGGAAFHPLAHAARLYGARDFEPGCVLEDRGQIVDAGAVLARRDDVLPFPEVQTDAGGCFVLADARPGASTLVVQADAAPNVAEQVVVQSGEVADVGVLRLRAGTVAGTLVASQDAPGGTVAVAPVVGAEVTFLGDDTELLTPPVVTGADGTFASGKLTAPPLRAFARRRSTPVWERCDIAAEGSRLRLRLPYHRTTLRVEVLAADGRPAVGCSVEIRHARVCGLGFDRVTVIPQVGTGAYETRVPGINGLLVVRADGYAPLVDIVTPRTHQLRLLAPTLDARFVVRAADGQPVEGASVYARVFSEEFRTWCRWGDLRPGHVKIGETDASGVLACEGLWESTVEVVAFHPRVGAAERTQRFTPQEREMELVLGDRARGRLLGVLTENRLPPQDRWLVVAERVDPPVIRRVMLSDQDGSFAFGGLVAGQWRLDLATRVGPTEAASMVTPLQMAALARGWPRGEHFVDVVQGQEQHKTLEIRRWVDDLRAPSHRGVVRVDGLAARGLAIHAYEAPDKKANEEQAELRWRLRELELELATERAGDAREYLVRQLAEARRRVQSPGPAAIALTDDGGWFAIDRRRVIHRLDVVAHVDGLARVLWSGREAKDATAIDIRTGSALVEVQARDGQRLASRMFVAEGQGDLAGVRVPAVTDRFGVLRVAGVPRGAYALRSLTRGGEPQAFPVPAFTVTGANWARATVAAR